MSEKFSLKDALFNEKKLIHIASRIKSVFKEFDNKNFVLETTKEILKLELKERITCIANKLKKYLPADYKTATNILIKSLPEACDPSLSDDDFGEFIYATYAEFVALNGCNKTDLKFSLSAIKEITQRFSCEYAIRNFLNEFEKETLQELIKFSKDSHYHVRRLACEGTRPKLPWGKKIKLFYKDALPILENLYVDKTRFVTRSVANHLNDITKIDPDFVIDILQKWKKSKKQNEKEINFIINHALRNLIKQGYKPALNLLGINPDIKIILNDFQHSKKVMMNEDLNFSFKIKADENADLIIDYIIHFQSKLKKISSKKVFKIKKLSLLKDEESLIIKNHKLRQFMTTRTIYAGIHHLEVQINGKSFVKKSFLII